MPHNKQLHPNLLNKYHRQNPVLPFWLLWNFDNKISKKISVDKPLLFTVFLRLFTVAYGCLQLFTVVYGCLSCLRLFTVIYRCLRLFKLFTVVYGRLQLFTVVYGCLRYEG